MTTELTHSFRCPSCDGLNDLDAEWCMQCGRRFERPERGSVAARASDLAAPTASSETDGGGFSVKQALADGLDLVSSAEAPDAFDDELGRAFAVQNQKVTWSCTRCSHLNDIKASECTQCGRSFVDSVRMIVDSEVPMKQSRSIWKALGIVSIGAVVMRLVAGLISPWTALAVLGAALLRFLVKFLRA